VRVFLARDAPAGPSVRYEGGSCVVCFLNVSGARTLERVYLEQDLDSDAQAHATVRRLRLSERTEMVTRISRMTVVWPSIITALVTFWLWVSFRRLAASPRADRDRRTRSLHLRHSAATGQISYLSSKLTAVGPRSFTQRGLRFSPGWGVPASRWWLAYWLMVRDGAMTACRFTLSPMLFFRRACRKGRLGDCSFGTS
jgi:hypothetical protein